MQHAQATHVLALWAAAALLALPDALLAPHDLRGAAGAAYLAANVFVFFAALLLLAHARSALATRDSDGATHYAPLAFTHTHDEAICCLRETSARAQNELTHVFLHVLCAAYVRTACGFEFRALLRAGSSL